MGRPGNYHLTLRFIGEIDEGQAADVDAALSRDRAPRLDLTLATVNHFGLRKLWVGVERNDALQHLHAKIESALTRLGFPPDERRYTPHVTLARLKGTPKVGCKPICRSMRFSRAAISRRALLADCKLSDKDRRHL